MKFMKHALLATLLICQVADAQVYNYFPPPGITYTSAGGMALGSASVQGIGTLNAQGLYVNGTAVSTAIGANPTGTVGLSTVNGSASTFMRSDAAPSLSQTISPTMTGAWTFTPGSTVTAITANAASSSIGVKINGGAFQYGEIIQGPAGAGTSNGLNIIAGTNASDTAFAITNALNTLSFMTVLGSGSINVGVPTGGGEGIGTINSGGLYVNGSLVPYANASPTMTGNWTFTPSSGVSVTINGASGQYALGVIGNSSSTHSLGLNIAAGTTAADAALYITNQANTQAFFKISGDGGITATGITDEGLGTLNAQGLYVNGTAVLLPSGNAATATALATTPTQCSGTLATGIAANGNANCTTTIAAAANPIVSVPNGSGPTQIAYAFVSGSPSTCTLTSGSHTNNTSSCTYNGVGVYTVQFTGALNNSYVPICQATVFGSSGVPLIPEITTQGVGSGLITVRVQLYNTSFANTDGSYNLTCFFQ